MTNLEKLKEISLKITDKMQDIIEDTPKVVLGLAMAAVITSSTILMNDTNKDADVKSNVTPTEIVKEQVEYFPTEAEEDRMTQIQDYLYDLNITDTNGKTLTELTALYEAQIAKGEPGIEFTEYVEYIPEENIEPTKTVELKETVQPVESRFTDNRTYEEKQESLEEYREAIKEQRLAEKEAFLKIIDNVIAASADLPDLSPEDISGMFADGATQEEVDSLILDMKKDKLERVLATLHKKTSRNNSISQTNGIASRIFDKLEVSKLELPDMKIIYEIAQERTEFFETTYPNIYDGSYSKTEMQTISNDFQDSILESINDRFGDKVAEVEVEDYSQYKTNSSKKI